MRDRRRPLRRRERCLAYGVLGWAVEVTFTASTERLGGTGDNRLEGHTYLWMLPIYGLAAVLFEPAHDRLRGRPPPVRAAVYAAGCLAVEALSGSLIRRLVGVCPWDYTGRGHLVAAGGATRLDYAPLWAAAGFGLERVHDALGTITVCTGAPER